MIEPGLRKETRYGMPEADQILYNRYYITGYSYYFRQAKWALEIINPFSEPVERADNFRSDYRIPINFRPDLVDYSNSGYDRGHLVASANQIQSEIQNSETFLLSNMSPQKPAFNRGIWRELEEKIRNLNSKKSVYETYVICGPVFYFDQPVVCIGDGDNNAISIPVPNGYFKSILTENKSGSIHMWSFIFPNDSIEDPLEKFQVPVNKVEKIVGIKLWEGLMGKKIDREKSTIRKMWK